MIIARITGAVAALLTLTSQALATGPACSPTDPVCHFRQLDTELRSPNIYRSASGAPGPAYWQQQADYDMDIVLDEETRRIIGSETITYTNNAPDRLDYLWVALDLNRFADRSLARESEVASAAGSRRDSAGPGDSLSYNALRRIQAFEDTEYGFEIKSVTDARGRDLSYTLNDTMMRIDLETPLLTDDQFVFTIEWENNILDENAVGGRGGFETVGEHDVFFLAQWFPRMASYTDYAGWQNDQFLGRGEFTLEFGDYDVRLTVPADHVVSSTGVLQNPREVLTRTQRQRLDNLSTTEPRFIVTPEEALENEADGGTTATRTWHFRAENVRDFAWSSSRKYIWDAMLFEQDDPDVPEVLAMSFYPNEAEPIWSQYSTQAVVHTMDVYNRFAFNYPYPTAQSVNAWERGGMEYPMITFNGYRPVLPDDEDGEITYSRRTKYGLIGVIIHEIGHIYFPMVVNSDERRHTWMDEGINTFLEFIAEYEWEEDFPILGNTENPLDVITRYMTSSDQVPIMTQSDSILQFGPNAYSKPASALIVLRESVMGRELFDFAFRTYAQRWKFKRPTPEDFFRTLEDASAVDLDWFWRGWFFDTGHVDLAITGVREYQVSTQDPDVENRLERARDDADRPLSITARRNREEGITTRLERFPDQLEDFYTENDKFTPTNKDRNAFEDFLDGLEDWERDAYERAVEAGEYIYFVDIASLGGLVSPIPLTLTFADGEEEFMMIPAEIWRRNADAVTKLIVRPKQIASFEIDVAHQIADADHSNNAFPAKPVRSRLEVYKSNRSDTNLMADMMVELKADKNGSDNDSGAVPLGGADPEPSRDSSSGTDPADASPVDASGDAANDNRQDSGETQRKSALRRTLERLMGRED